MDSYIRRTAIFFILISAMGLVFAANSFAQADTSGLSSGTQTYIDTSESTGGGSRVGIIQRQLDFDPNQGRGMGFADPTPETPGFGGDDVGFGRANGVGEEKGIIIIDGKGAGDGEKKGIIVIDGKEAGSGSNRGGRDNTGGDDVGFGRANGVGEEKGIIVIDGKEAGSGSNRGGRDNTGGDDGEKVTADSLAGDVQKAILKAQADGKDVGEATTKAMAEALVKANTAGLNLTAVTKQISNVAISTAAKSNIDVGKVAVGISMGAAAGAQRTGTDATKLAEAASSGAMAGAESSNVDTESVANGLSTGNQQTGVKVAGTPGGAEGEGKKDQGTTKEVKTEEGGTTEPVVKVVVLPPLINTNEIVQNILANPEVEQALSTGNTNIENTIASDAL